MSRWVVRAGGATFASAFARGSNNFDAMRLGAALLVLASHAYVLTGHAVDEPVGIGSAHMIDGGGLAVAMFFIVSGFLIARSAGRHRPWAYLRARALRIYPAFLLVVVLQTVVLGPALTRLPVGAYFANPATWLAVVRAMVFSPPAGLPGVFGGNPVPGVVNGSLWTLRVEALCYLGLLGLALARFLRRGWVLAPLAGAWALLAATMAARAGLLPPVLASLRVVSIVDCLLHFMMGAALWVYAGQVRQSGSLAGAGAAVLAVAAPTSVAPAVLHLVLPYLVVWLGLCRPLNWRLPDVSYGTYLYAFPVQQALVAVVGLSVPAMLAVLAVPPTLALAALSWWLVERPAGTLRPAAL